MKLSDITIEHIDSDTFFHRVMARISAQGARVDFFAAANYVSKKYPNTRRNIITHANNALSGMLVLPGTGAKPAFVGNPPNWFSNPVNDNEYVWLLNRMYHWKTLMQAYALTKDMRYAEKTIEELEDWIVKCTVPSLDSDFNAATPWRSLEAGIRMYIVWPWLFDFLLGSGLMSNTLLEKFAVSVYEHGKVLYEVCPLLWPNADHNHYFMENLGLLIAALMFPEFKTSSEWKHHALCELGRCVDIQFTEDGGHIEGCPHYHNLCVHLIWLTAMTAHRHDIILTDGFLDKAVIALDYSLYSQRPTGAIVPWGDSDADSTSIRAAVEGFLMFKDRKWLDIILLMGGKEEVKEILLEYLWEIPDMDRLLEDDSFFKVSGAIRLDTVNHQKQLKQATVRTGWNKDALSLFFACRTPVNNGHAHIDPMGFDFTARGKALLVDPGRFCYREDEDRRRFKSAAWHNTITINGREPFEYVSSWKYGPQKYGNITGIYRSECITAIEAVQHNYEPVIHRRLAAIIDDSILLIADRLDHLAKSDSVQIYFHIDDVNVNIDNSGFFAETDAARLFFFHAPGAEISAHDGLVSEMIDTARKSTRICLSDSGGASERVYAAVCVCFQTPAVGLSASVFGEGTRIQLMIGDKQRIISWNDGRCE